MYLDVGVEGVCQTLRDVRGQNLQLAGLVDLNVAPGNCFRLLNIRVQLKANIY